MSSLRLTIVLARDSEWKALGDALVETAEGSQAVKSHISIGFLSGGGLDQLECTLATLRAGLVRSLHGLQGEHLAIHSNRVWGLRNWCRGGDLGTLKRRVDLRLSRTWEYVHQLLSANTLQGSGRH